MTVKTLAIELSLWTRIVAAVEGQFTGRKGVQLLQQVAAIPVRRSRALRSLGIYVSKSGRPVCIRLQFAQEPETLRETLLHETAHACDHLFHQAGQRYRRAHGPNWQAWAAALGITPAVCGQSRELEKLYVQRLKVVATCQRCGFELRRLRRLNSYRHYLHRDCGGALTLL